MPMEVNERRLEYLLTKVKLPPSVDWYEVNYRRCFPFYDADGGININYISYAIYKINFAGEPYKYYRVAIEYSPLWEDDIIINKLQYKMYNFFALKKEFNPDGGDLGREESEIPQPK